MREYRPVKKGFTLIELLVVVAIIALLIAILLPSLSKARAQARSTLCASRISQLTKSLLLYGGDYDEGLPFVGVGYDNINNIPEGREYAHLGPVGQRSEGYFIERENWLIPGTYYTVNHVWLDTDWASLPNGGPTAREGTLFTYSRFENLYRCPDFERIANKTQNVFNYSRSILARKFLSNVLSDPVAVDAGEAALPGPLLKLSAVYAPAAMGLMIDEQWDFHCAGNYNDPGVVSLNGFMMGADPIHGILGDMIGSYHGTVGRVLPWDELKESQMGNVSYYDGHVSLVRDPWPWRAATEGNNIITIFDKVTDDLDVGVRLIGILLESVYAQRGIGITTQQVIDLLLAL